MAIYRTIEEVSAPTVQTDGKPAISGPEEESEYRAKLAQTATDVIVTAARQHDVDPLSLAEMLTRENILGDWLAYIRAIERLLES